LKTCLIAASLYPLAALRRKSRAPLRGRAAMRTGKKMSLRSLLRIVA